MFITVVIRRVGTGCCACGISSLFNLLHRASRHAVVASTTLPDGQFTLAFVGCEDEAQGTALELTHNWGEHAYEPGSGFGHIAIAVRDVSAATELLAKALVRVVRPVGPLKGGDLRELLAFIEDPDGYRVELIERRPDTRISRLP